MGQTLFKEFSGEHRADHVTLKLISYLFFDVSRVQGVVESRLGSFVRFPGLHQVHRDAHVDTDNLMTNNSKVFIIMFPTGTWHQTSKTTVTLKYSSDIQSLLPSYQGSICLRFPSSWPAGCAVWRGWRTGTHRAWLPGWPAPCSDAQVEGRQTPEDQVGKKMFKSVAKPSFNVGVNFKLRTKVSLTTLDLTWL